MITPYDAMRQASGTAREYARDAVKVYTELFGMSVENDPQAAATFVAAFMRTAAHDYFAWTVHTIGDVLENR
jgi:hypothetical protein